MSSGHLKPFFTPGTLSDTLLPGTVREPRKVPSETTRPAGMVPGCHVTVARPSVVWRFPAIPRRTVWVPIETAGSGAATTTPVVAAVADVEPPAPVPVA